MIALVRLYSKYIDCPTSSVTLVKSNFAKPLVECPICSEFKEIDDDLTCKDCELKTPICKECASRIYEEDQDCPMCRGFLYYKSDDVWFNEN